MLSSNQSKNLVVMKFGGSCLQDAESFQQSVKNIEAYNDNSRIIVVCSAIKGITDELINFYKRSCVEGRDDKECRDLLDHIKEKHEDIVNHIIDKQAKENQEISEFIKNHIDELKQLGRVIGLIRPSQDIQDLIISYGEKLSTFIFSKYLASIGFRCKFISSDEIILTDDNFGNALPLLDETEELFGRKVLPLIDKNLCDVICITGFYGSTKDKKITTLGRGGTDLTAAIIAYCLKPKYNSKVIYWKDVPGFLNADPRIAKKTALLKYISYIEAKELAFFGSKVLHPVCLDVNENRSIPSEIRPFKNPESNEFTTITKEISKDDKIIKAVTSIQRLSMVTIESGTMISLPGTVSKLFSLLGDNNVNIKFISQSSSENNITFGIDIEDSMTVSHLLRRSDLFGKQWFSIKIDNDISLIAVIGAGMLHTPGIAGKIFTTLGENKINVRAIAQGSSELNITIIIERKDCKKAINVLYDAFINKN
ncbi:MAG: aspartate kinase [Candidatus Lokiarchaeota archaeon]|nr:aspartate kinase [Candidatus Lokiarchaeota archaeon]MBD3340798.1 aspartate kinase [Candidatus Lokiarchaeota archaeon]